MKRIKLDFVDFLGLILGGVGLWLFFSSSVLATVWVGFILIMIALFMVGLRKRG